ncbi:Aspartic proteinase nepenthesin-2 [Triticum urartu]|uniref:Aspartic proteinase nepenthesin-2 n=1 Tax=Triticum urartu TaxID=4572 RepID=M7ZCK1_TRIUA|nr:Aspartic proteinase nepenthesin-2 [Triticum urartu]
MAMHAMLLPLALLFVSAVIMPGASASSPSSLRFHYIDPRNFTMAAATTYPSTRHAMLGVAARDGVRVEYLQRRLSPTTMTTEVGSEVVSGISEGSGEYFVRVGVGSPPTEQYLVMDSGSDVIWVQCRPCAECYQQADPLFDPAASASFAIVPCGSGVCRTLPGGSSGCADSGACRYQVSYGDGSYTQGVLAMETLTFGDSTPVQGVAIGCGHRNRGLFEDRDIPSPLGFKS